jgi:DNA-binding IclR family transcriptional regulator
MNKQTPPSPAVAQAFRILDYLGHVRPEAGVSEISRALEIGKSHCFHLLATMAAFGVVTKDRHANYRLGPKLVELGTASRRNFSFRGIVGRAVRPLVEAANVCCLVGQVVEGDVGIVVVERILPAARGDLLVAPIGEIYPITAPAMGRAVLAQRSLDEALDLWRVQRGGDAVTLTSIRKALTDIRDRGFATSVKEYQGDVNAVACVVLRDHAEVALVLCLIGYEQDLPAGSLPRWGSELKSIAAHLSDEIDNPTPVQPAQVGGS